MILTQENPWKRDCDPDPPLPPAGATEWQVASYLNEMAQCLGVELIAADVIGFCQHHGYLKAPDFKIESRGVV